MTSQPTTGSDDERIIRDLDTAWSTALGVRDLDAVMSYYAHDAVFLAPNAPIVTGKEAIRAWFARRIARPRYTVSFAPTAIVVAGSRDMAYETGVFRSSVHDANGRPMLTTGKHLVTWGKRGGAWKVTAESINADHPPADAVGT